MKVTDIQRTIRSTKRLTEIIKVLSKFGFREIIVDLKLDRFISGKKSAVLLKDEHNDSEISRAVRMRHVFEELGPTYIKLGQILATRPDLIPPDWAEEFKNLQDNCKQVPFSEINYIPA